MKERIDKIEDALVGVQTVQREMQKDILIQMQQIRKELSDLKNGHAAIIGRNALIEKTNTCIKETNKLGAEFAKINALIDKVVRKVANALNMRIDELLSSDNLKK